MVKKIDLYNQNIILENKTTIPIKDIIDISGDVFKTFDVWTGKLIKNNEFIKWKI